MMFPSLLAIQLLPVYGLAQRLASISDVPRIAQVATAGFAYSNVFEWERPYHRNYPIDTILSYEEMFASVIRNPDYIGLVVEDIWDPRENEHTNATIPPSNNETRPGQQVIVGVASWKLPPGSPRRGQFMDKEDQESLNPPNFDPGLRRDRNEEHTKQLDNSCQKAEEEYFADYEIMDMLVVHPAYWRRGHGSNLVKWGMNLAREDHTKSGVIASEMGENLYQYLGYRKIKDIYEVCNGQIDGHELFNISVTVSAMVFDPFEKEPLPDL